MEKLRVDNGVRTIEVNDAGEYLEIHLGDLAFLERFSGLFRWAQEEEKKYKEKEAEVIERHGGKLDPGSTEYFCEYVPIYMEACEKICAKLDEVFGEGCCRKVFPGVERPDVLLLTEFMDQIVPLISDMLKEYRDGMAQRHSDRGSRPEISEIEALCESVSEQKPAAGAANTLYWK